MRRCARGGGGGRFWQRPDRRCVGPRRVATATIHMVVAAPCSAIGYTSHSDAGVASASGIRPRTHAGAGKHACTHSACGEAGWALMARRGGQWAQGFHSFPSGFGQAPSLSVLHSSSPHHFAWACMGLHGRLHSPGPREMRRIHECIVIDRKSAGLSRSCFRMSLTGIVVPRSEQPAARPLPQIRLTRGPLRCSLSSHASTIVSQLEHRAAGAVLQ